jgi:hypothetical protein
MYGARVSHGLVAVEVTWNSWQFFEHSVGSSIKLVDNSSDTSFALSYRRKNLVGTQASTELLRFWAHFVVEGDTVRVSRDLMTCL